MKTKTQSENRTEYRSPKGLAAWWEKDGAWHIALPCPNPDPETGLRTGGYRWTGAQYHNRAEAITAIENP